MIGSLYAVTVNWNLKQDTLECVASLLAAGVPMGHVIVVDNGSTDGSTPALHERFGDAIHSIESSKNLGFGGGCNLGIEYALDQGAEWILLLNNDTVVAPALLVEWLRAVAAHPDYAIIGPLILEHHAPDRIWYLGDRLVPTSLITYSIARGQIDTGRLAAFIPVDFVCGCGMFVRREVFEQIGFFDPSFFMYAEEVDLCWRARAAGFRLACATQAKMWHKISISADRDRPMTRYLRIRNQILFYRRYARRAQVPLLFAFTLLRSLRVALCDLAHRQPGLIAHLVRGWADGWMGRQPGRSATR
jgi:GT2 family glycosyltransferase